MIDRLHHAIEERFTPAPATLYARCGKTAEKMRRVGNKGLSLTFAYCLVLHTKGTVMSQKVDEVPQNPLRPCAALAKRRREERMDINKYEKSLDNRCATPVSHSRGQKLET